LWIHCKIRIGQKGFLRISGFGQIYSYQNSVFCQKREILNFLLKIDIMNYKSDNLTPKQKKKALLSIFFLVLIISIFFIYKSYEGKEKEELLASDSRITICKMVGVSTYKTRINIVEYEVSQKKYTYESVDGYTFQIGEFFQLKYSKKNPSVAEVIFTKPIIFERNEYQETIGKIISLYANSRVHVVKFIYEYEGNKYERATYTSNFKQLKEGCKYKILVNKKNPKISYLNSIVMISN
jgi:hypothetical protein